MDILPLLISNRVLKLRSCFTNYLHSGTFIKTNVPFTISPSPVVLRDPRSTTWTVDHVKTLQVEEVGHRKNNFLSVTSQSEYPSGGRDVDHCLGWGMELDCS